MVGHVLTSGVVRASLNHTKQEDAMGCNSFCSWLLCELHEISYFLRVNTLQNATIYAGRRDRTVPTTSRKFTRRTRNTSRFFIAL